jgi:hypothetical protein
LSAGEQDRKQLMLHLQLSVLLLVLVCSEKLAMLHPFIYNPQIYVESPNHLFPHLTSQLQWQLLEEKRLFLGDNRLVIPKLWFLGASRKRQPSLACRQWVHIGRTFGPLPCVVNGAIASPLAPLVRAVVARKATWTACNAAQYGEEIPHRLAHDCYVWSIMAGRRRLQVIPWLQMCEAGGV